LRKIKLSDFGTTLEEGENKITENLVARFYRPPEIYLGYPYDSGVDVWSFACTLFELFTGKVLFPGNSDSHMLKLMIEVKGPIPKKMRTQGKFSSKFFEDFSFVYSKDQLEGPIRVPLADLKKEKNLGVALEPKLKQNLPQASTDMQEYLKDVNLMQNLLEQCLEIDPNERITPDLALNHPFLTKKKTNN
jgi:serine/threonine-protein kinase PRP4